MPLRPHQLSAVVSHSKPSRIVLTPSTSRHGVHGVATRPASTSSASRTSAITTTATTPDHSSTTMCRSRPSLNSRPRPPRPTSAPTLMSDTVLTDGEAQPGDDPGQGQRQLDREEPGERSVAHAIGGAEHRLGHRPDRLDDVPDEDDERVQRHRDHDRLVVREAEPGDEDHEERDRGDRVDRVRRREQRRVRRRRVARRGATAGSTAACRWRPRSTVYRTCCCA